MAGELLEGGGWEAMAVGKGALRAMVGELLEGGGWEAMAAEEAVLAAASREVVVALG